MPNETLPLPWEHPHWLTDVTTWIQTTLQAQGWASTGPMEMLHQRPWSAFARVPTTKGPVYFKAPAPAFKYEAPLTQLLARLRPDCTVPVLGIEPAQGWILAAEAGVTLRSADPTPTQVEHWVKLLPHYALLQREMAAHLPELLATGISDRRLTHLPMQLAQLLEDTEDLRVGLDQGLTPTEYEQLRVWQPRFAAECAELASTGLPATLTHEEVHDANVLVNGDRYIYTDWSDCSVGHPFFTLVVLLRAAAHRLKLPENGPEIGRVRAAYLEPWTDLVPRAQLEAAADLAYRLGMVNRSLSWHQGMRALAADHKAPYADNVPGWLQDYLVAENPPPAAT